jgi:hypothetical protein
MTQPSFSRKGSLPSPLPDNNKQSVLNPDNTITYKQVNDILRDSYNFDESIASTSLDILALYLKGQKIIYTEAKTLCEKRLNTLMLPAIFISAVCSILNFILKDYSYGTIIIASLNAFNSFLLSLISYLKLDAKAEAHKTSAYKFQKLESMSEFQSGKSLFFRNSVDVLSFVERIEKEIIEIRESNQFIIPEIIRLRYPKISSSNVFTMVKEIKNDELLVINNLKNAVQSLHTKIDRRNEIEKLLSSTENESVTLRREIQNIKVRLEMIKCKKKKHDPEEDHKDDEDDEDSIDTNETNDTQERMERGELMITCENYESILHQCDTKIEEYKQDLFVIQECLYQLNMIKNKAFDNVVDHRKRYLNMSDVFKGEIDQQESRKIESYLNVCDWFKT